MSVLFRALALSFIFPCVLLQTVPPVIYQCEVSPEFQEAVEIALNEAQLNVSPDAPERCGGGRSRFGCGRLAYECELALEQIRALLTSQVEILHGLLEVIIMSDEYPGEYAKLRGLIGELGSYLSILWDEGFPISLERRWQCYETVLFTRLDAIEKIRGVVEEERVARLVELLSPESLPKAETYFHQLNNNSLIPSIMEGLYGDEYGMKIAHFLLHITRTVQQRLVAYPKWFELIANAGELISSKILVLRKALQVEIDEWGIAPPKEFLDLKEKTEIYKESVLKSWSREVLAGDYENILGFARIPREERTGDLFDELLPFVVEYSFEDETKYEEVMDFIKVLERDHHKAGGLGKVLEMVKAFGDENLILFVTISIKEAGENALTELGKERFENLKGEVPLLYRRLLWHSTCYLRTKVSGTESDYNYFYADFDNFVGGGQNQRGVYKAIDPGAREDGRFRFNMNFDGGKVSYNIESVYDGKAVDERFLDERRPGGGDPLRTIGLRCSETDFPWEIEVVQELDVKIRHKRLNGYLMGAGVDETLTRRNVIVWTHSELDPTDHVWNLECYD